MEKQVFKVVRTGGTEAEPRLMSARLKKMAGPYEPVEYYPGEWTYASDGLSGLFAFEDVEAAKYFARLGSVYYNSIPDQVWLAEATGVRACPRYIPDIMTLMWIGPKAREWKEKTEIIKTWWARLKQSLVKAYDKPAKYSYITAPRGSVLCSSIKLISRVP